MAGNSATKLPAPSTRASIVHFPLPYGRGSVLAFADRAALAALQEVVDQLGAGVAHFHVEGFDPAREVVVRPHRGHGHEQTDSGGDESFGNTAGYRAQAGRLLGRNALERVDDAGDGAEQTYERGRRRDGRETGDATLQFGVNDRLGALESAVRG